MTAAVGTVAAGTKNIVVVPVVAAVVVVVVEAVVGVHCFEGRHTGYVHQFEAQWLTQWR